jgi:hypothetical protein
MDCCPEWPLQGEGTQIEPAAVFAGSRGKDGSTDGSGSSSGSSAQYQSYGSAAEQDEWLYLNITQQFAQLLHQQQLQQQQQRGRLSDDDGGRASHSEL